MPVFSRIFITGASGGLGAALARASAAPGHTLGLFARRTDVLQALAAQLPGQCECYAGDVRDSDSLRCAAADFITKHGAPDLVIANAGVSIGTLTEAAEDEQSFRDVFDINVIGMMNTFQPFVGAMRAAGGGTLAGIASVAGYRGLPGSGAYSASKAAAISYLESLRVELRSDGIRVATLCPGYIATEMTEKNPYRMPFIMSADQAASKILRLLSRGKTYAVIPWQMALVARLMHVLPRWAYDPLAARAGRKPRRGTPR
jgi:short-subunit dehydrogenase